MAGKEQRGVEAADADLFQNRPYVLTPSTPESAACRIFRSWLKRIGASIIDMPAQEHDSTVAFTSHLPQVLSTALAITLARQPNPSVSRIFGTGLLDMTRLALSSPNLWLSILETNKDEIGKALEAFSHCLAELKTCLRDNNLESLFLSAASFAEKIRKMSPTSPCVIENANGPGTSPYERI
jgi:prephenate dehydrogenase